MSRLSVLDLESDTGPPGQTYAEIKKSIGSVPNTFATIAAHGPAANVFNRINDTEIDFPAVG